MRKMDIYDLYLKALALLNTQQGGCLKPTEFVDWINQISTDLFGEKFASDETSQMNDDKLNLAFLKSLNIPVTVMAGKNYDVISIPSDYGYFSSLRIFRAKEDDTCGCENKAYPLYDVKKQCATYEDPDDKILREQQQGTFVDEISAKKVANSQFGAASTSVILKPTLQKPIVTMANGGLKIVPRGVGIVVLDYFSLPTKAFLSYTTDPDTQAINYDLAGSTQLNWPDLVENEFLARVKKKYASATRNTQQYVEAVDEAKNTK